MRLDSFVCSRIGKSPERRILAEKWITRRAGLNGTSANVRVTLHTILTFVGQPHLICSFWTPETGRLPYTVRYAYELVGAERTCLDRTAAA